MKKEYEQQYHCLEEEHWWFQSRRQLVRHLVMTGTARRDARILEIGCSGGPLMQQLQREGYQHITGIDISSEAIALCKQRNLRDVHVMDAQRPAFPDEHFDLLTASDVLEHLADQELAVHEWWRVLKPGGQVIIFVPAFRFLWSEHDTANHHFRRYRRRELVELLDAHHFAVERSSYWNFLLFFPIALVRLVQKVFPPRRHAQSRGDLFKPPEVINGLLAWLLRCENRLMRWGVDFPFGVSAMVVGRKRTGGEGTPARCP